ncbi:hypothetical protein DL96DRAFT_1623657 [Flagelloscypha sp. PMI_526]|nr:hypothetical protein DL96DRAFT_1623657 [Flagelloscypha sp. PMI_526]
MFSFAFVLTTLFLSTFSSASVIPEKRGETIPGLLHFARGVRSLGHAHGQLEARQGTTCDIGFKLCDDGSGCCGLSTVCTEGGCCPLLKVCTGTATTCDGEGLTLCPNDPICCPTGNTCEKDAAGKVQCVPPGGLATSGISTATGVITSVGLTTTGLGLTTSSRATTPTGLSVSIPSISSSRTTTASSSSTATGAFSAPNGVIPGLTSSTGLAALALLGHIAVLFL